MVDVNASVVDESDSLRTQVLAVGVIYEGDSKVHVASDDVAGNSCGCFEGIASAGFANLALNVQVSYYDALLAFVATVGNLRGEV